DRGGRRPRGAGGRRARAPRAERAVPPRAAPDADLRAPPHAPRGDHERDERRAGAARLPRHRLLHRVHRPRDAAAGRAARGPHDGHRPRLGHRVRLLRPAARRARAPHEPRAGTAGGDAVPVAPAVRLLPARRADLRGALPRRVRRGGRHGRARGDHRGGDRRPVVGDRAAHGLALAAAVDLPVRLRLPVHGARVLPARAALRRAARRVRVQPAHLRRRGDPRAAHRLGDRRPAARGGGGRRPRGDLDRHRHRRAQGAPAHAM
ncbi:MAG: hypothetical protein AVDCRST_MAG30-2133, partial [uncultured Solirubrobacteraceae bacterium]